MKPTTTFIIPSIGRESLNQAIQSTKPHPVLHRIDTHRRGESGIRNQLIKDATTEWVSFLDDDDTVTEDYVRRLEEEIEANPHADVIHFREYFLANGHILPSRNTVEWGNIGICFSVRRKLALEFPFVQENNEDFHFVRRLHEAGKKIVFSPYLTYRVRH